MSRAWAPGRREKLLIKSELLAGSWAMLRARELEERPENTDNK